MAFVRARKGFLGARSKERLTRARLFRLPLGEVRVFPHMSQAARNPDSEEGVRYPKELFRGWAWPPKTLPDIFKARWHLAYHDHGVWKSISAQDAKLTVFEYNGVLPSNVAANQMWALGKDIGALANAAGDGIIEWPRTTGLAKYASVFFIAEHYPPDPPWSHMLWLRWEPSVNNWTLELAGALYAWDRGPNSNVIF